jgi:hypothetical protein
MGNYASRTAFFKENDINPYKILSLNKDSTKKELLNMYMV